MKKELSESYDYWVNAFVIAGDSCIAGGLFYLFYCLAQGTLLLSGARDLLGRKDSCTPVSGRYHLDVVLCAVRNVHGRDPVSEEGVRL